MYCFFLECEENENKDRGMNGLSLRKRRRDNEPIPIMANNGKICRHR